MATDWSALRTQYIAGNMTMRALAEEHGIKAAGVMGRAAREGWEAERKQLSASVSRASLESVGDRRTADLAKFNADDLSVARALRALVGRKLSDLAQHKQPGKIPSSELSALARTAAEAQKIGRLALGASTENATVSTRELPASVDEFV